MIFAFHNVSSFFKDNEQLLTISGAVVAGWFGFSRYRADEKWKKLQAAFDYAQRIFDDQKAMTALRMLDWDNGEFPAEIASEFKLAGPDMQWDRGVLIAALRVHDGDPGKPQGEQYDPREYAIRELFDVCLAHFERLGHFVRSGILSTRSFPTTLAYYARIMNEDRSRELSQALFRYMLRYDFDDAHALFERLAKREAAPFTARIAAK